MILICDTGPIIAFAKADRLEILRSLASDTLIPGAVYQELLMGKNPDTRKITVAVGLWLNVREAPPPPRRVRAVTEHLGNGEQQVIHLAANLSPDAMILMDDKSGRNAAVQLGLPVVGTIGILIAAKQAQQVVSVSDTLLLMRSNGYWLSDKIIAAARRLANE